MYKSKIYHHNKDLCREKRLNGNSYRWNERVFFLVCPTFSINMCNIMENTQYTILKRYR